MLVLLKYLTFHLGFARFFGVCLQTPWMTTREKSLTYGFTFLNFLLMPIFIALLVRIAFSSNRLQESSEIMGILLIFAIFINGLIIVMETFLTKHQQYRFWNLNKKIEKQYFKHSPNFTKNYEVLSKSVKYKFYIVFFSSFAVESALVIAAYCFGEFLKIGKTWAHIMLFNMYGVLVGKMKHLSHLLTVEILNMHIRLFNEKLYTLKRIQKFSTSPEIADELNFVKFTHGYIWEATCSANYCHRWSQLSNIAENSFKILSGFYWIYFDIKYSDWPNCLGGF